jgi:hypothetical protein
MYILVAKLVPLGNAPASDPALPLFFGLRLLVGMHDGAVDHQAPVVSVGRQLLEQPLSHTSTAPAAEPPMHRPPFAVALPLPVSVWPASAVLPAIRGRNPHPLSLAQLVPPATHQALRFSTRLPVN